MQSSSRCRSIAIALLLGMCGAADAAPPAPATQPLLLKNPLEDKNFYLLSAIQADPAVGKVLAADPRLEAVRLEREHTLAQSRTICQQDTPCIFKSVLWTAEEVRTVSLALSRLDAEKSSPLHALVRRRLRPSGAYASFADRSDADLLAFAWEVCASGLNEIVSVYGLGQPGRYPLIDAASLDPHSASFREQAGPDLLHSMDVARPLFFEPALSLALDLLRLNHRDEAARFEPMETGVNQAALKTLHGIAWLHYPFTVIVVPGAGGGSADQPLTDAGRRRLALAVDQYRAGNAPLILVSGGYVHPSQTPFAEAVEMKKALIQDFHVPDSAILIDPHARHTTTNLRNANREILRYGIPVNRPALVVSDAAQIASIQSPAFRDRCLREMGYVPFRDLDQTSKTSLGFIPRAESLEQDPIDPLDP